ncbi:MAG: sensor histidine kinase, partial [Acetanaerobacterium sp.]
SDTLGRMLTYVAVRVNDDLYIRLAMENEAVNIIFKSLLPSVLVGMLAAALMTPFVAATVARGITEPLIRARNQIEEIAAGGDVKLLPSPSYEELTPIVDSVNTLSMRISDALGLLQNERERTKTLLDNMEEGLAIIDSRMRVASVNLACERYLGGANAQGRNIVYLTRDKRVLEAIEAAVRQGRSTIFDEQNHADGGVFSVHITPARGSIVLAGAGREEHGAILLLTDVTTLRENEKMRSEFVANASHELKTPITSIKGFAELLAAGLVEDERTTADYLKRITDEATRMTYLINDIIKISELESGKRMETAEDIDLAALARELAANLTPIAAQKDVTIEVIGEDIRLRAQREDMRQILGNLMDNAVKYNKVGGSVVVTCERHGGGVSVAVADTGIGIAREHHARVFERFYCVDKGRSRTV